MYDAVCEYCKVKGAIIEDPIEGNLVCRNCRFVLAERIISDIPERGTGPQQVKRTGAPTKPEELNQLGVNLIINQNGDTKKIPNYTKKNKIQKNFIRIHKLLSKAGINDYMIEKIKLEYANLAQKKNMQGRNIDHIILALYYYICKKEYMAIKFKEIAKMFPPVTVSEIKKAFNSFKTEVVELNDENQLIQTEKNYIRVYLGGDVEKYQTKIICFKILENINKNAILESRSPITVSGLALLISYKLLNNEIEDYEEFYNTFSKKSALSRAYGDVKDCLDKIVPIEYIDKVEELKDWSI